jgi:hypothetical protein
MCPIRIVIFVFHCNEQGPGYSDTKTLECHALILLIPFSMIRERPANTRL